MGFMTNILLLDCKTPGSFIDIEEWYGFSRETGQIVIFGEYEETEVEGFEEILEILTKVM